MTGRPPSPLAPLAAATTPVVAAALLLVAVLAAGCETRAPSALRGGSPPPAGATPAPAPQTTPASPPTAPAATGAGTGRLVVVVGGPAAPRASILDPAGRAEAEPLALPAEALPLAAVAAASDGRLAAVAADGRAWVRAPIRGGDGAGDVADPAWTSLHAAVDPTDLPGPVLGAAWTRADEALLLLSGSPGSGVRRMALVTLPVEGGGSVRVAIVALEADGPGIAPLDDGQVAFVARDRLDRGALARLAPAGTVATLPVAARSVAAGGDTVVLVDDTAARFGTLTDLRHGVLPTAPLPIEADGGLGAVAVAIDGQAVALVRLDGEGAPAAVDVVRWAGTGWEAGGSIPLDAGGGSVLLAWLP